MNWLLLNAAPGSKIEQALEKLVDFGMDVWGTERNVY